MKRFFSILGLVVFIASAGSSWVQAGDAIGLTGVVTSQVEGPMEGVVVSAKRVPGTITVSVISDRSGIYSFPAARLMPGKYQIASRAIGYSLADPEMTVTVGRETTRADIKLIKTADLASQMSDIEWLMSAPGPEEQKEYLFRTCSHCHTLGPIFGSNYDAAAWITTFARMRGWDQVSSINFPVKSPDHGGTPFGNEEFAKFLSTVNLSARPTHDFELKTLPRPKGADTKVIITEFDLPRPEAEPHDVAPDKDGMIWYQDFRDGIVGRLNTKSGEAKEWRDPATKPGFPSAFQCVEWDAEGNIWVGRHDWNGVAKFDRKTEKFTNYDLPEGVKADFVTVGGDGKVWAKDTDGRELYRINPASGEITKFDEFPPELMDKNYSGPKHHIYGITADAKGNVYEADIEGGDLFRLDGATGKVSTFPIPTKEAGPRRMHMDSQGRVWIGEYYGKKIAMFDPATGQFQEWNPPLPWYGAYDVVLDKEGYAWTGTMTSEVILRLDPKSGEFRQYLLPRVGVNVRRVEVDDSGARPTFWVGENHQAKIAMVEPRY
ncbi:MAG TPA: carboxypeptidase regulatory-like domain-containing protein [Candidatus Acidoferrales bacterium]|nr:carboxypeptidase regulatory-like domain-containing protein [Candidatus Acidoferrales bacterium]